MRLPLLLICSLLFRSRALLNGLAPLLSLPAVPVCLPLHVSGRSRPWAPVVPSKCILHEFFSLPIMVFSTLFFLTCLVYATRVSGLARFTVLGLSLLRPTLSVCRRRIVFPRRRPRLGLLLSCRVSRVGCVVLLKPPLVLSLFPQKGRFLLCSFEHADSVFRVVSLYAPNCDPARNLFLDYVSTQVDSVTPTLHDFNTIFDSSLDRSGSDPLDGSRENFASCSVPSRLAVSLILGVHCTPQAGPSLGFALMGVSASLFDLIGVPGF